MERPDRFPTLDEEQRLWAAGHCLVAGLDEAGRGAWAGPLVAAAVILPAGAGDLLARLAGVRDSKQLSPGRREVLLPAIQASAVAVGVGVVPVADIDGLGIVAATRQAMGRAIAALSVAPDCLLIDYLALPGVPLPQRCLVKGDARVLSIAAASIVAKVSRDRLMAALDGCWPGYGLARNKGYGTAQHQAALAALGPSGIHRRSFAPVRALQSGHDSG